MISRELLDLLCCTSCGSTALFIGAGRRPALECEGCGSRFPIVGDIVDMLDPEREPEPGQYRIEMLHDLIAGLYDVALPATSLVVWNCSPLRYLDVQHRALGRANPGVLLEAPVGTGFLLSKGLADYHDVFVVGVDTSWKMLRRAQTHLGRNRHRVHLVRAELGRLPLRSGVVDSIQSLNGLHAVVDRPTVLSELARVTVPSGFLSGTALARGQELFADAVLDRYERYGVYPMMRTPEFIVEELRSAGFTQVHYETQGAVVFFDAVAPATAVATREPAQAI